jgi:hypothetical protein
MDHIQSGQLIHETTVDSKLYDISSQTYNIELFYDYWNKNVDNIELELESQFKVDLHIYLFQIEKIFFSFF